jgi:indolepyruvate ferredoxin oxidoreductase
MRWAIASGVNLTYKLLYNHTVAMTGGQDVSGALTVPELTRLLAAEGVAKTIVTTEEPRRYRGERLAAGAEVRPRERFKEAEAELAATPGVTVLIHDQQCAAEKRRLRKRGRLPTPNLQVAINERVCEGCGDCGRKSNCLSVLPVETEFGRKTRIHAPSCNTDLTCLEGDCPSFMLIRNAGVGARAEIAPPPFTLPEPRRVSSARIRLAGIGGTGVVTVSQVLGIAATLEGKHVTSLDQTGLAQKGGSVVSDVGISTTPLDGAMKAPAGAVDLYLALDLLSATAARNLVGCDPERTRAVISTNVTPTGEMVVDSERPAPAADALAASVDAVTVAAENVRLDAEGLALDLFGDSMPASVIALGAAYQLGALPVSARAITRALQLNGTAVDANVAAFEWGRAVVVAPEEVERARRPAEPDELPIAPAAAELVGRDVDGELRRLLEVRASDLIGYQNLRYARRYVAFVERVREHAASRVSDHEAIAEAVARHLYKLMAYKDEYEVARLHLAERARIGPDAKITWKLHPPVLRALGMQRKLSFGEWFVPAFRVLRALRRLRGTRFDVFGLAKVRRVERALIGEYQQAVLEALDHLSAGTRDLVLELCELPDLVRGYEDIKLANVDRYRERLGELRAAIAAGEPALPRASSGVAG